MKQATTIEEQINLLEQRGIIILDKEKAKTQLIDIGYFRLGSYFFPFENSYPEQKIEITIINQIQTLVMLLSYTILM